MAERSIHELESNATAVAHKALALPLKAAIDVLNLATRLQANDTPAEKLSKATLVRLLLLQRIQNDLRVCMILVEHGYPLQALTQAAGIFEAWVTIANIKTEDDAAKWLSHAKENESFGRIRPLTKQALENIDGDAKCADKMYFQYQQLCMPKHLNPIVERSRGYELDGNVVQFKPGPDTSELAIRHGWYALERASRFANLALFTIAHSQETSPDLHLELVAQQTALDALQDESAKRWPDNYPAQS
jgi:hypothetical protein